MKNEPIQLTDRRTDRRGEVIILFTLWLMVFAASSQIMIVAPILPRIAEGLGVDQSHLGFLITIYAIFTGLFAFLTGPISDRYGRRTILMAGTGLMSVALILHTFADTYPLLLTVRGIAGAAGGILSGGAVSYVGDYFPVHRRGWASGWVLSGIAAGQILGIPLGTLLAGEFGYQAPFTTFALVSSVAFLLILFRLPKLDVEYTGRLTVRRALRGYGELIRRREVVAACAVYLTMFMGVSLFVTFFPTWLEGELGFGSGTVALLYLVGGVANVIAGPRAGYLSDRIGRTKVIMVACSGLAVMMLSMTLLTPTTSWLAFPLFFLLMGMVAARMSPLQALMTELTTNEKRGQLMSLVVSTGQVGIGIGSGLASVAWRFTGFRGTALFGTLSVMIMVWLVWRYLARFERQRRTAAGTDASSEEKRTIPVGAQVSAELRQ